MPAVSRLSVALVLTIVFSFGVLINHLQRLETNKNLRSDVSITKSIVSNPDRTFRAPSRRSYRVSMVSYPKSGSTWLALLLGNFMLRYHANSIKFGVESYYPCDLDEYTEYKTKNYSHCCVFFMRVPGCVHGYSRNRRVLPRRKSLNHAPSANAEATAPPTPLEPMPLFSGDKHMQYLRKCGFTMPRFAPLRTPKLQPGQRMGYKCALSFSQAIQTLTPYDRMTQRFFLLVRDPRDISGSCIESIAQCSRRRSHF